MADLDRIQTCALNPIDPQARRARLVAAVIGDSPSRYSKSPALWNAAFAELHIDARYVALDVETRRLGDLLRAIGESPSVLGLNVTVPHKLAVLEYLDELDESVKSTGAVNTVARAPTGALVGSNTDGIGFIETLLSPEFGDSPPLFPTLAGMDVLVLGAGGSARAVAFALGQRLAGGKLLIANRHPETAEALAQEIHPFCANARAIGEDAIAANATTVELIVNCTTKGQAGRGERQSLERYSALAPASGSRAADIDANHKRSLSIARSVPRETVFYDLVYHPEETVFLRHARETGHRAVNGRGMIVAQAVESFMNHICRRELEADGLHNEETRRRLAKVMLAAW
ncbi:MAG TPA: shikimate dehydrogenase [Candidatus Binatia bacterium]|nr:shikimate dehydrogenase [Candidatus Binatia bacterium]